jgi:putative SOS response-associated peptidase YedK
MCGRYELHSHPTAIALAFGLARPPGLHARYNIAPMTDVAVVRINSEGCRELVRMRWGLVPRWAKDPSIGAKMINARSETLSEKRSFQTAYRRHRCLLPANGFYEWRAVAGPPPHKEPWHIGLKDGGLFALGGLCERWLNADGDVLDSCTIVTTAANELIRPLHERMPVMVAPADYARWLDPASPEADTLLKPYPADAMTVFAVSTRVNSVRHDDESLIKPVRGAGAEAAAPAPSAAPTHDPEQESLF